MQSGAVPILKPPGITSHRVVSLFRRITGIKKAGHTGTLDPAAVGVVVVCFGTATRLVEFTDWYPKLYRAEVTFGWSTDTQDSTGTTRSVTPEFEFDYRDLDSVLEQFVGEIEQIPPMMSAIKVDGVRLYKLARKGRSVEREPRSVTICSLRRFEPTKAREGARERSTITYGSRVMLDIECSSGTYVRTLCEDIGAKLGVEAHMSYLVRIAASGFTLDDAVTLEELDQLPLVGHGTAEDSLKSRLEVGGSVGPPYPPEYLVRHFPKVQCLPHEDKMISNGVVPHRLSGKAVEGLASESVQGRISIHLSSGQLAAVARIDRRNGSARVVLEKVVAADR